MKLFLVVVVLTVAAFTANCRDIHGGQPDQNGDDTYISNGLQEVKERSKPELRGKNDKKIMKQVLAKLKDLMNTNKNLTVDMNIIKEHQLNETDSNTEVKMELQNINKEFKVKLEYLMETVNASNSEIKTDFSSLKQNLIDTNSVILSNMVSIDTSNSEIKTDITSSRQNLSNENAIIMSKLESISARQELPAGFEVFNAIERVIRRTTTADTKVYYDTAMRFCDQFNAKPFIPRTEADYELYNIVRNTLDYGQWLPANDRLEEGLLRWYNGELDTNVGLWKWNKDQELWYNSAPRDCLYYGCCHHDGGGPAVHMGHCDVIGYPPICEII